MREEVKTKLKEKKTLYTRLLTHAVSKRKKYEARLSKGVAFQHETFFGEVSDQMQNNMRARYYWARWKIAEECLQRKLNKVKFKLKEKTMAEALDEGLKKAQEEQKQTWHAVTVAPATNQVTFDTGNNNDYTWGLTYTTTNTTG